MPIWRRPSACVLAVVRCVGAGGCVRYGAGSSSVEPAPVPPRPPSHQHIAQGGGCFSASWHCTVQWQHQCAHCASVQTRPGVRVGDTGPEDGWRALILLQLSSHRDIVTQHPAGPGRQSALSFWFMIVCRYLISHYISISRFQTANNTTLCSIRGHLSGEIRRHGTECPSLAVEQPQLDIYNGSSMAGEFWIQLFGSCVQEQEPPPRYSHSDNTAQILRKSNSPEHKTFKRKASERMLMMLEVDIY